MKWNSFFYHEGTKSAKLRNLNFPRFVACLLSLLVLVIVSFALNSLMLAQTPLLDSK